MSGWNGASIGVSQCRSNRICLTPSGGGGFIVIWAKQLRRARICYWSPGDARGGSGQEAPCFTVGVGLLNISTEQLKV